MEKDKDEDIEDNVPKNAAIWIEKYRPGTFTEIKGQDDIKKKVQAFIKQGNMPHLMFSGPAGTGKSTMAIVVAKKMYGENWRQNFLELNASVTGDTPVLVKINGKTKRTNFSEIADIYFKRDETRVLLDDIEVLSINNDYKVKYSKANYLFRHKVNKIVKIKYEGGEVKTSMSHSLIVFDKEGKFKSIKTEELKKGDLLITFKTELEENKNVVNVEHLRPKIFRMFKSGVISNAPNPKIKVDFKEFELDTEFSWALGLYAAEGCTSVHKTSAHAIYTLAYPQEVSLGNRVLGLFNQMDIPTNTKLGSSGFDRNKKSSIQLHIYNTQIAKFLREHFYNNKEEKHAKTKRIPGFMYNAGIKQRLSFLEGYHRGDGCGLWNEVARISSRSQECLIDTAWLARISKVESSCFKEEARLIWKNDKFSYIKSELLPADIFQNILMSHNLKNARLLRHSMYSKKSKRVSRNIALKLLNLCKNKDDLYLNAKKLADSCLSVVKITDISCENYNDYVYDFSVPEAQMFWGGTMPILLHNSDERGIDVVRHKVKDFARTRALGNVPFKIIFLDESDALTKEAQQALRRTMENYTTTCRFILSNNYSSKIIDPIQSRCTLFRFRPLEKKDVLAIIENIEEKEKIKIDQKAKEALFEISEGDCRKLENILQSCAALDEKITEELVFSMASIAKPTEVKEILELAVKNKFIDARNKLLDIMLKYGLSGQDIIKQIQKQVLELNIDDRMKVQLIDKCGEIEFRMTEGSDEYLQLEALLANFTLCSKKE